VKLAITTLVALIVFFTGQRFYYWLLSGMRESQIPDPPDRSLLTVLITYGCLLYVTPVALLWPDSRGTTALIFFCLVLIAPVVMAILAIRLLPQRKLSAYHYGCFIASAIYFCLSAAFWTTLAIRNPN
jgi:predicted lysophospholipase L1 biosynthesis ABC-type transport system permease subunit